MALHLYTQRCATTTGTTTATANVWDRNDTMVVTVTMMQRANLLEALHSYRGMPELPAFKSQALQIA